MRARFGALASSKRRRVCRRSESGTGVRRIGTHHPCDLAPASLAGNTAVARFDDEGRAASRRLARKGFKLVRRNAAETEFPPDAADPANPKATLDLLQPRLRIQRPLHPTDPFRSVRGLNVAVPATMGLSLVESSRSQGKNKAYSRTRRTALSCQRPDRVPGSISRHRAAKATGRRGIGDAVRRGPQTGVTHA